MSGAIGVLDASFRVVKNDRELDVADEGAEAFFAFADGLGGTALFGDIGDRDDDLGDFTGSGEFGDGIHQGPDNIGGVLGAYAAHQAANGLFGCQHAWNRALFTWQLGAVLAKNRQAEFIGGFSEEVFNLVREGRLNGLIGEYNPYTGIVDDDAHLQIFHE